MLGRVLPNRMPMVLQLDQTICNRQWHHSVQWNIFTSNIKRKKYSPIYDYEVDSKRKSHRPVGKKEWEIPVESSDWEAQLAFLCSDQYEYDIINIKPEKY